MYKRQASGTSDICCYPSFHLRTSLTTGVFSNILPEIATPPTSPLSGDSLWNTPFLESSQHLTLFSRSFQHVLFKKRLYFQREGTGRETSMCGSLLSTPYWGPGPKPRHHALTGNRTDDPLVPRLALKPLSHASQGHFSMSTLRVLPCAVLGRDMSKQDKVPTYSGLTL